MSSLEERIDEFFANATTDEVMALLDECGLERYRGGITVEEYLKATEHLVETPLVFDVVARHSIAILRALPPAARIAAGHSGHFYLVRMSASTTTMASTQPRNAP